VPLTCSGDNVKAKKDSLRPAELVPNPVQQARQYYR